jgi:ribosomal protein S18 acetylase RimI-like enzyme
MGQDWKPDLKLVAANRAHLLEMQSWFPDESSCHNWGSTRFRYPFDEVSFVQDSAIETVPSYALIDGDWTLLGFGQCRAFNDRCHLSRLAIAPSTRSEGLGTILIERLMNIGRAQLGLNRFSLYAALDNERAERLYARLGFNRTKAPDGAELVENHFMTLDNEAL